MKCAEVREVLYELFGSADLPEEVRAHLAECSRCREAYAELRAVAAEAETEGAFAMNDIESARLLATINEKIDAVEGAGRRGLPPWLQWAAPVAAVAALLVGMVVTGGRFEAEMTASIDTLLLLAEEAAGRNEALYDDLDERTVRVLLEDFSARPTGEPSNVLLDDLTEDEYEYLAKTFDVGEIL